MTSAPAEDTSSLVTGAAVRRMLALIAVGYVATVASLGTLAWDGSWFAYYIADTRRFWIPNGRYGVVLLQWPAVLIARAGASPRVVGYALCAGYAAVTLVGLSVAWLVVRRRAPHLILWAAAGSLLLCLPGQWFGISEAIVALQLCWPLLFVCLLGVTARNAVVLLLAGWIAVLHPGSGVILATCGLVALVVAALSLRGDRREQLPHPRWQLIVGAVLVLAGVLRATHIRAGYEQQTLSAWWIVRSTGAALAGPQLVGIVCGVAMLAVVLARRCGVSVPGIIDRLPGRVVYAVMLIAFVGWVAVPRLWTHVLAYRAAVVFIVVPVAVAAFVDLRLGRSAASYDRILVGLAFVFATTVAVQAVQWHGLTGHLERTMTAARAPCVEQQMVPWLRHTPLDLWPTSPLAAVLGGAHPRSVMLPPGGCATARQRGVVKLYPDGPTLPARGHIDLAPRG